MNKHYIIEKLKEIKPVLHQKYGVTELALFGSYSRDEQSEQSDIDIMFDYEGKMGWKIFDVFYSLDDLFPDKKVQVASKRGIKEKYFNTLKQDLIYA
ncbi:MAG: nucleotidyltransferase domain-containing protein [Chitinophagaceae bacterium]|jgi:predicted nucleotidyltransferase|nr:nucleotidyltransferase domain-containing protein [Chitinophagaceae bacterium]